MKPVRYLPQHQKQQKITTFLHVMVELKVPFMHVPDSFSLTLFL
jgi:hypothetical protein